jgi:uncharacterized membrane protein
VAEEPTAVRPRRGKSRVAATLKALIRTRVTAGLLVVLPIWITILLVKFVFTMMRDASQWVVLALLRSEWFQQHIWRLKLPEGKKFDLDAFLAEQPALDWGIAIVSVFLTIFILYSIGLFTRNIVGRRLIDTFERLLDRVPLVKTVYRSSKQILATFSGEQSREFQRVALVPFPQEKMRCVGFITATFKDSLTGEELATVFIPTTPNPTTGYLQILKRKELVELDWSVEDAVRTIMSGGILRPDFLTIARQKPHEESSTETQPELEPPPSPADAP